MGVKVDYRTKRQAHATFVAETETVHYGHLKGKNLYSRTFVVSAFLIWLKRDVSVGVLVEIAPGVGDVVLPVETQAESE